MSDDTRHEPPGLPGPQIVGQFGSEVRTAIAGGIETGTATAVVAFRRIVVFWCIAGIFLGMLGAGAVAWLVSSRHPIREYVIHHADGLVEICVRAPESTDARPTFTCRLYVPKEDPGPGTS